MDFQAITIYVVCDDVLSALGVQNDPQAMMSHAEVVAFSSCSEVIINEPVGYATG